MAAQQGQQLLSVWLSQGQQLLQDISNDLHGEDLKEFVQQIFTWIQEQIQTINYHLSTISFNPRYIYQQLANLHTLEGRE